MPAPSRVALALRPPLMAVLFAAALWCAHAAPAVAQSASPATSRRATSANSAPASAADSLDARVEALLQAGRAREDSTVAQAQAALQLRDAGYGAPEGIAAAHRRLGRVYHERGEYAAARDQMEQALKQWQAAPVADPLAVASARRDLAAVLVQLAEHSAACQELEQALGAQEAALGADAPEVASTLNALGAAVFSGGDAVRALAFFERALTIRRARFGEQSLEVAESLQGVSSCAFQLSDFVTARSSLERALRIRETQLGPQHRSLAALLSNLGGVLAAMGNLSEARPVFERALALREQTLGPDHPSTGISAQNLGACLRDLGELAQARPLFERALRIAEQTRGPDHPYVALGLIGLAELDRRLGDYDAAQPLYERALAIDEKRFGAESPETALVVGYLGQLYRHRHDHRGAKPYYERQLALLEPAYGPENYRVGETLALLGMIEFHLGEDEAAVRHSLRAEELCRQHMQYTAVAQSEREALEYAGRRVTGLDVCLTLATQRPAVSPALVEQTWDALIRSRALVLDEMSARRRPPPAGGDPELARLRAAYAEASRALATRIVEGPGQEDPAAFDAEVTRARRDREQTERELAERSSGFRAQLGQSAAGFQQVKAALPPRSALLSYARFDRILEEGSPLRTAQENLASPEEWLGSYAALVQRADGGPPHAVALLPEREVEARVAAWRDEAAHGLAHRGRPRAQAEADYRAAGAALRAAVWDPVAPLLDGVDQVLIVPDGPLHLVNFATLPTAVDQYLIETGPLLHTLTTERDLVPEGDEATSLSPLAEAAGAGVGEGTLLALGGAAFDAREPAADGEQLALADASAAPYRGPTSACASFRELRFPPLPASGAEARAIVRLWEDAAPEGRRAIRLAGAEATEANVKRLAPGCRVLHLATHGFFLGDDCQPAVAASRGVGTLRPAAEAGHTSAASSERAADGDMTESPLLLSGLALASANRRAQAGPQDEDGILTAEEIAALDLTGTQWAVLSACESGVGPVAASEGVFGLRRAFRIAGARTVIMGLWSVQDELARAWMVELYRQRLQAGRTTAEAVRGASLALLRERRVKGRTTHPSTWGAFTAAGGWR